MLRNCTCHSATGVRVDLPAKLKRQPLDEVIHGPPPLKRLECKITLEIYSTREEMYNYHGAVK